MSRVIGLNEIDFSGARQLFTESTLGVQDIAFSTNPPIPEHVQLCVRIIHYLVKYPMPLKAYFSRDRLGNYFTLEDDRRINASKYKVALSTSDELVVNDLKKLKDIYSKLQDKDYINLVMMGRSAGGSVVKMLLRDPSYMEKYVDTINKKPRLVHSALGTVKKVGYGLMGFAFVSSVIVFGPAVALPYLAYAL